MKPDLELILSRRASADGVPKTAIVERALRRELDAPLAGLVREFIDPRQAKLLHDTSARLGYEPTRVLESLISVYLPRLTVDDVDPERRKRLARERAREHLGAGS